MLRLLSQRHATWGLDELLDRYPGMSRRPASSGELVVAGTLDYRTNHPLLGAIEDAFKIELRIPAVFPRVVPRVRELDGRVPENFHRIANGDLCLGSPLRLQLILSKTPTLVGFVEKCVVPYLVGFNVFEQTGKMPFGELAHGLQGLFDEYKQIFGVKADSACVEFLRLLSLKRRVANKRPCPCSSGRRLGKCHNRQANNLRNVASRFHYRSLAAQLRPPKR